MAASNSAGVCTTDARRISVAKTRTGSAATDSTVVSVTKGLRVAYPSTECDILNV